MLPTTVVIPTVGRRSLQTLLSALAAGRGPRPVAVIVVDDRIDGSPLETGRVDLPGFRIVRSRGVGPAAARNVGWRLASTPWVSFLDDDVVPDDDWCQQLASDLAVVGHDVAGIQGQVRVPLPADRPPTDWERSTAGLGTARWITADMTYRRAALSAVGGFDERFPRAFREDADLGLRVTATQGRLVIGRRWITHPVRPTDDWVSLRQQAGNADDMLMRRLHGRDWRRRAGAGSGRRTRHLMTAACGAAAIALTTAGSRRSAPLAAVGWLGGTAEFALARILPGPRDRREVRRLLLTSVAIPWAASWHTLRGLWSHRSAAPWRGAPELVLFDRDGTLVDDVPYNGDPLRVTPVEGARPALDRLRASGVRIGVISNQSGVASGRITMDQVGAVNRRVEELLGPFDVWQVCPHGPDDGCRCRKPAPGMVKDACQAVGVEPVRTVVIGDIGSDIEAAVAAGATGVLVPTTATRTAEVAAADRLSRDLPSAVDQLLDGLW